MKFIINNLKKLEKTVVKIMKYGFEFSICICLLAAILLFVYQAFYTSPNLYYIGIKVFKTGLLFISYFVICGIATDTIKKEMG